MELRRAFDVVSDHCGFPILQILRGVMHFDLFPRLFPLRDHLAIFSHLFPKIGTVYNHPAALSIDAMVNDAFLEADRTLQISDSISDPEAFLTMTDCIIPIIERSKEFSLANARRIIRRLRCRRLYRFVDEFLVPAGTELRTSPEDITTCQDASGTGVNLVPGDIHVAHVKLNFGMKDRNPVDKVLFFQDWYVCMLYMFPMLNSAVI